MEFKIINNDSISSSFFCFGSYDELCQVVPVDLEFSVVDVSSRPGCAAQVDLDRGALAMISRTEQSAALLALNHLRATSLLSLANPSAYLMALIQRSGGYKLKVRRLWAVTHPSWVPDQIAVAAHVC